MKKILLALALTASSQMHVAAFAQHAAGGDALYKALGERQGLTLLVDDFVGRLYKDPRIGHMFKETKPANLKEQIRDQFCVVTGGPCKYEGDTMKASHASLGINKGDFNALVEVLQVSMDANGIPFYTQNQFLALLAPMHRDIITK